MNCNFSLKSTSNLILSICLGTWALQSCISTLDQDPSQFEPYLVVEGFITDQEGPHEIKITRVASFAGVLEGGIILPQDAEVVILDQNDTRIPVQRTQTFREDLYDFDPPRCIPTINRVEVQTNHLTPSNFKAEVGSTYTLEISINGKTYQSTPQLVLPTPPISELEVAFKELPSLDPITKPSGIEVFCLWQDPESEQNYYSWKINGIYQISTPDSGPPACCLFDPRDGGEENCWIIERDIEGNEIAFSDIQANGKLIRHKVGFVPDDGLRFASTLLPDDRKYYIEVEHYQVSQEAHEFLSRIKTLQEIDGEIFDPIPLSIRGNITNIDDENEPVIGYFGAYSVKKKGIFVSEDILPFKQRFTGPCGDCRFRPGATIETPTPFLAPD